MKATEIKQLLPIMQAFAEGRIIQVYANDMWIDLRPDQDVSFSANPEDYRIKPEKQTTWTIIFSDGSKLIGNTHEAYVAIAQAAAFPEKFRIVEITWEE